MFFISYIVIMKGGIDNKYGKLELGCYSLLVERVLI